MRRIRDEEAIMTRTSDLVEHQKKISKASKKLSTFFRRVKMMNRFSAMRTSMTERVAKLKELNTMAVKELGDDAKGVVLDLGKGKLILQQKIFFMPGTAIIEQKSVKYVETIAHVLRTVAKIIDREGAALDLGQIEYVVDGHTHANVGKDPLAPKAVLMSFNRANSVMEHLVASGADASHLFAHGFGGSKPLGGKAHDDRRVEICVISPARAAHLAKIRRMRSVMVTCPNGARPGTRLRITTKEGQKITAVVPEGTTTGQKFRVEYVAAPPKK